MILYKDNPNLDLKTVTTIKGDKEYRINCKRIKDPADKEWKLYLKDRDCFEVNNSWYRKESPLIIFDYEQQKYLYKKDAKLINGIVGFDESGKPIIGHFSPNPYRNVTIVPSGSGSKNCICCSLLEGRKDYIEDKSGNGKWHHKDNLTSRDVSSISQIRNVHDCSGRGYNIEDNSADLKQKISLYNNYSVGLSKEVNDYAKYLGNITWGLELEIAKGWLPEYLQSRHGVVVCRDGSIGGGPELVTIPLNGAKGLQTTKELCKSLSNRSIIDINCSFHLHIGTIPTDKLFLIAIYTLCRNIQDDVFQMFPYYKTDPSGIKRKNYNQKLERLGTHTLVDDSKEGFDSYINDFYERIFQMLTKDDSGRSITPDASFNRKTREHPIKQKWQRAGRYYWMNLLNMVFSNRNTVEFRVHHATTNHHKVINWLFICNAIVKYAEKHAESIIKGKKVTFLNVLNYYKDSFPKDAKAKFLSAYIIEYYNKRKEEFSKDVKKGDKVSSWDIENDALYKFEYEGVKELF